MGLHRKYPLVKYDSSKTTLSKTQLCMIMNRAIAQHLDFPQ